MKHKNTECFIYRAFNLAHLPSFTARAENLSETCWQYSTKSSWVLGPFVVLQRWHTTLMLFKERAFELSALSNDAVFDVVVFVFLYQI